MKRAIVASLLGMLLLTAGCSGAGSGDATAIAKKIAQNIEGATVVTITESNDELGRYESKNPPKSVAVITIPGVTCKKLGVACGAEVEVSSLSPDELKSVAGFTRAMMDDRGTKVSLWVKGSTQLAVPGTLDPINIGILAGAFDGTPA